MRALTWAPATRHQRLACAAGPAGRLLLNSHQLCTLASERAFTQLWVLWVDQPQAGLRIVGSTGSGPAAAGAGRRGPALTQAAAPPPRSWRPRARPRPRAPPAPLRTRGAASSAPWGRPGTARGSPAGKGQGGTAFVCGSNTRSNVVCASLETTASPLVSGCARPYNSAQHGAAPRARGRPRCSKARARSGGAMRARARTAGVSNLGRHEGSSVLAFCPCVRSLMSSTGHSVTYEVHTLMDACAAGVCGATSTRWCLRTRAHACRRGTRVRAWLVRCKRARREHRGRAHAAAAMPPAGPAATRARARAPRSS